MSQKGSGGYCKEWDHLCVSLNIWHTEHFNWRLRNPVLQQLVGPQVLLTRNRVVMQYEIEDVPHVQGSLVFFYAELGLLDCASKVFGECLAPI